MLGQHAFVTAEPGQVTQAAQVRHVAMQQWVQPLLVRDGRLDRLLRLAPVALAGKGVTRQAERRGRALRVHQAPIHNGAVVPGVEQRLLFAALDPAADVGAWRLSVRLESTTRLSAAVVDEFPQPGFQLGH